MPVTSIPVVQVDLGRVRQNARTIRERTGVRVLAVVKADAYGLGAKHVVRALAETADGFCVFRLREAIDAEIWTTTQKETIALGPDDAATASDYIAAGVRPAVWTEAQAERLRAARPLLAVDTGMQRFNCPPEQIDRVLQAGGCDEAFTHAISLSQVARLKELADGQGLTLHAAGSSLLEEPEAWLDAVRPGLALYREAVRVATPLIDLRASRGAVGYSGFSARRHGIILAGYSHGLRVGPCVINGRRSRLLEVGMQSAYVEAEDGDRVGDEVVLLGGGLEAPEIATAWGCSPQEVLVRLTRLAERSYVGA